MEETPGKHIIQALQKKWQHQSLFSNSLLCLSVCIIGSSILHKLFYAPPLILVILSAGITTIFIALNKTWRISEKNVAIYLNNAFPALEESTGLLLRQAEGLNFLEKLQAKRVDVILQKLEQPAPFKKAVYKAILISLFAIGMCFILLNIDFKSALVMRQSQSSGIIKEKILQHVAAVTVKIIPPSYTNLLAREQATFNVVTELNATLIWEIKTTVPVKEIYFIFNDSAGVALSPINNDHKTFTLKKLISKNGFYQLKIDGQLSGYYQMEVIKDLPPVIAVMSPKPNTVIDFGQQKIALLNVNITDDYGIKDGYITATIASGKGESVKFKAKRVMLNTSFNAQHKNYQSLQYIDLDKMGLQPGDELYFYVTATDTYNQQTRSDIYIITLPDTAQLMDMEGLANNVNFKPEFFRSERQIIIDAEQLLKEKDTIAIEKFNQQSNDLGADQKLLRLRYGKFLGEENESNMGITDAESLDATSFGDASKMIDAFTDKHDNAEDASFLDIAAKHQLKAVLNEMWKAELQLRSYKPKYALPFAYKALQLLKDLQQQSRAYVAKASFKTSPLKPEKRLTGDLSKIKSPVSEQFFKQNNNDIDILHEAISILEEMNNGVSNSPSRMAVLAKATQQLNNNASSQPGVYLKAYEALRKLSRQMQPNGKLASNEEIILVQNALQKLLAQPLLMPGKINTSKDDGLSKKYFNNLYKTQQ